MSNEQLLKDVRNEACSCDLMIGRTCNFCRFQMPKLRKALKVGYHRPKSPYDPRNAPRLRR